MFKGCEAKEYVWLIKKMKGCEEKEYAWEVQRLWSLFVCWVDTEGMKAPRTFLR